MQTRTEHVAWVKQRAKQEYEYYVEKESHGVAVRNATASVLSDLGKHPETANNVLVIGSLMIMTQFPTKDALYKFIDGIN